MISRNKTGLGNLMNDAPKPGDFPVGSVESRVAMRAMIERGKESGIHIRVIRIGHPRKNCEGKFCHDVSSPDLGPGTCGLLIGKLFVNEDGEVEESFQVCLRDCEVGRNC
jgi:hypothetical protein